MRHARDIERLRAIQARLTWVLIVIAIIALIFTATSVTLFARRHGVHPGIAWLLDPMVALALGAVLFTDGVLAEYGIRPRGWSSVLRYFAGLATWVMNCWSSVWPDGTPVGVPEHADPAGLVLHSIPPVLLIVLAEAVTGYRRAILAKVAELEGDTLPTPVASGVSPSPATAPPAAAKRLVICGDTLPVPTVPPRPRLDTEAARTAIERAWRDGLSVREAARVSTRSAAQVQRVYARLDATRQPQLEAA
jgi:hypothetical protein